MRGGQKERVGEQQIARLRFRHSGDRGEVIVGRIEAIASCIVDRREQLIAITS